MVRRGLIKGAEAAACAADAGLPAFGSGAGRGGTTEY